MSDIENVREGDIVSLKSGGPLMTVTGFDEMPKVHFDKVHNIYCSWFVDENHMSSRFSKSSLKVEK